MPQPLAPIHPVAPEVSLVTSARSIPVRNLDDAWADGLSFTDDLTNGIHGWPRCPDEDLLEQGKEHPADIEMPMFMPWTMYVPVECVGMFTTLTIDEIAASGQRAIEAKRPYHVARELWTGEVTGNPSLQSTGVDITGGAALPAKRAVGELIAAFQEATGGTQATVHAPAALIPELDDILERSGNRLLTQTGDIVVPGPGYPSTPGAWGPITSPGNAEADEDEAWIYVTGPVELAFHPDVRDDLSSGRIPAATFARLNRYVTFFEQDAILRFPTTAVFAALAQKG